MPISVKPIVKPYGGSISRVTLWEVDWKRTWDPNNVHSSPVGSLDSEHSVLKYQAVLRGRYLQFALTPCCVAVFNCKLLSSRKEDVWRWLPSLDLRIVTACYVPPKKLEKIGVPFCF
jgi:hypothetical protein